MHTYIHIYIYDFDNDWVRANNMFSQKIDVSVENAKNFTITIGKNSFHLREDVI